METVKKIGSKLIFIKKDGSTASYDYNGKICMIGNMMVKDLNPFFKNVSFYDVRGAIKDGNYRLFFNIVKKIENRCRNMGTLITRMGSYPNTEAWSMIGIDYSSYSRGGRWDRNGIYTDAHFSPSDIPKEALKFIIKYKSEFHNMNNYSFLAGGENDGEMGKFKVKTFLNLIRYFNNNNFPEYMASNIIDNVNNKSFIYLLKIYKYEIKALLRYTNHYLPNFEGYNSSYLLSDLEDYAKMQTDMLGKGRFDKYPKYFRTVHDIVSKNHRVFDKNYDIDKFKEKIDLGLEYSSSNNGFLVQIPKVPKDILEEASNLKHCVSSYIDGIIEGKTQIGFLRKVAGLSHVTIEIRNKVLTQARGVGNRDTTDKEKEFLKKYCVDKEIKYSIC